MEIDIINASSQWQQSKFKHLVTLLKEEVTEECGTDIEYYFLKNTLSLCLALEVEEFAEEVKGTGHLFVEAFCSILGDLVVNLQMTTVNDQTSLCLKPKSY